jgi:hypothetical protein
MTERHPAEQFNPAKCRLHRFSGFYRFCSFFRPTPIQTISKTHFHRKQRVLVPTHSLGVRLLLVHPSRRYSGVF